MFLLIHTFHGKNCVVLTENSCVIFSKFSIFPLFFQNNAVCRCFMGEEIALSLRAWTNGWDIYAPPKNLIAHQYRPGRMGLPKFWENTGRVFGRPGPGFNTALQTITLQRIKHMVGYEEATMENLENHGYEIMLTDYEYYGPGEVRTMDAFLEHTRIDVKNMRCGHIDWCNQCTLD